MFFPLWRQRFSWWSFSPNCLFPVLSFLLSLLHDFFASCFVYLGRSLKSSRLASKAQCCWEWPWTSDSPASAFRVLRFTTILGLCGGGDPSCQALYLMSQGSGQYPLWQSTLGWSECCPQPHRVSRFRQTPTILQTLCCNVPPRLTTCTDVLHWNTLNILESLALFVCFVLEFQCFNEFRGTIEVNSLTPSKSEGEGFFILESCLALWPHKGPDRISNACSTP